MRMRGHPSRKPGRARSSHLRLSWRREHGHGTAGSSSMPGFTAPGAALLGTARSWRGIVPFTHLAREGRMTVTIGRRELLAALGGAAAAWPLAARAQQARLPTIGFLGATTPAAESQRLAAFTQRLGELGWIEGRTVAIDVRWAEGRNDRFAEIAAEFVRLRVDVIVTQGTASIIAAKQATAVIPIVFAAAGDPVGAGLVASLARPAGNVTGLSSQLRDTATKRLELLRDVVPNLRRLAIMANVDNASIVLEMRELQATVPALGLDVITLEIHRGEDIAPSFDSLQGRADALVVLAEALAMTNRVRISTLTLGARLP